MWGEIPQVPDFVVVGGKYRGGVMLLASKTLSYVELQETLENLNSVRRDGTRPRYEIILTAEMRDYIMVRAKSYPQAWLKLFDQWTPERSHESDQPELPAIKELPRRNV